MLTNPTKVIFLWHMHQPFYRPADKDYYALPWVRLHGIKDYYGMARVLERFEKIKAVFNFSGVLLAQLLDYIQNSSQDYHLILTLKNPAYLKKEEKDFILRSFFSVNFQRVIQPHRRYLALYQKNASAKKKFTSQEIIDLQVLFNLFWLHPYTIKEDKNLQQLLAKEADYTAEDKEYIIQKHYAVMAEIFPLYKKLEAEKRIELAVTPYHHPILPLIYDTDILDKFPYLKKPAKRFSAPADCLWQLGEAKEVLANIFGHSAHGSWPAEGSVSSDIASLYAQEGFSWIAADEAILFKSLTSRRLPEEMLKTERQLIYRTYRLPTGINLFFRDRDLSDAISFGYHQWPDPWLAAEDLLNQFKRIHTAISNTFPDNVITIIMDGENAWEHYQNNGVDFLETLYGRLKESEMLSSSLPGEFLAQAESGRLKKLAPGSWINADFGVWIGNRKNNRYWHILSRLKDLMQSANVKQNVLEEIKNYFYILEGSDWFWWNTFKEESGEFRKIFLSYVEKIYSLLGKETPNLAAMKKS